MSPVTVSDSSRLRVGLQYTTLLHSDWSDQATDRNMDVVDTAGRGQYQRARRRIYG